MEEKRPEHPGMEMVRWLKPGGCVLVLVITLVVMVILLTSGRDPVKGYVPPQSSEYYAGHLDQLEAELRQNLFPGLEGVEDCRVEDGRLAVTLSGEGYAAARGAILRYYDRELFEFIILSEDKD